MQAYRAQLLRFDSQGQALYDSDGLLVVDGDASGVRRVVDAGPYRTLAGRHPPALRRPGAAAALHRILPRRSR